MDKLIVSKLFSTGFIPLQNEILMLDLVFLLYDVDGAGLKAYDDKPELFIEQTR